DTLRVPSLSPALPYLIGALVTAACSPHAATARGKQLPPPTNLTSKAGWLPGRGSVRWSRSSRPTAPPAENPRRPAEAGSHQSVRSYPCAWSWCAPFHGVGDADITGTITTRG